MTTHISQLLPSYTPDDYRVDYVKDPAARRITAQVTVIPGGRGRYPVRERGYSCRTCQDRGVIDYVQEHAGLDGRVKEYTYVARCFCRAAERHSSAIPRYVDIFGAWPLALPNQQPQPPAPQPAAPPPSAPQRTPTSYTRQVEDLSDFE